MKTQAEYLASLSHCPFCDSDQIEGGFLEMDGSSAWQPVVCNDCGKGWNDIYNLVGYEEIT